MLRATLTYFKRTIPINGVMYQPTLLCGMYLLTSDFWLKIICIKTGAFGRIGVSHRNLSFVRFICKWWLENESKHTVALGNIIVGSALWFFLYIKPS